MPALTGPIQELLTTVEDRTIEVGLASSPAGGTPTVLSGFDVSIAFTTPGVAPAVADFTAAAWTGNVETISDTTFYVAAITVGPIGAVQLGAGLYDVWGSVDTGTETPMLRCPGRIQVVAPT